MGWVKQFFIVSVRHAEENSLSVCQSGQKGKAAEQKIAQIGTKWAGNDYSDIWLSQQKAQSGTPLILFFTLV